MIVSWTEFKSIVTSRGMDILKAESGGLYNLFASDENFQIETTLGVGDGTDDTLDFENNYLSLVNPYRQKYDYSGKPFARFAIANEGNGLTCFAINFTTATSTSLRCKSDDNTTDISGVSYAQYDVNGASCVDANAVMTEITIELQHDFEIVGGRICQKTSPTVDIYGYLTAVPDIPAIYGGYKTMCNGGMNLKMVDRIYSLDGKAPKFMKYDANLHTNKLRLRFYHPQAHQHDLMFNLDIYK